MKNNWILILVLLGVLLVSFTFVFPVNAQTPGGGGAGSGVSGDLNATVDTVVGFIRDVTLSALRFGLFLSGIVFLVSVVWGSARGSLATAIGNHTQASSGIITAIMAVGTLILVLVAVPLTNSITQTLLNKFLTPSSLQMNVGQLVSQASQSTGSAAPVDPKNILQIPELQQTIEDLAFGAIRFALGVGVIATVAATFLGAFDTQIGALFGGGLMASRGMLRIFAALGQLIILVLSLPLAKMLLAVLVPRLVNLTIPTPF
jgi:hypothetical protein